MKIAGLGSLVLLLVLLVVGCGSSTTTVTSVTSTVQGGGAHAASPPHQGPGTTSTTTTTTVSTPTTTTPGSASPTGSLDCGGGLTAGSHTSCSFAQNVRSAYEQAGGSGDQTVSAFSPTTGQTYSMNCTGSTPHVCTGGNAASVYFP